MKVRTLTALACTLALVALSAPALAEETTKTMQLNQTIDKAQDTLTTVKPGATTEKINQNVDKAQKVVDNLQQVRSSTKSIVGKTIEDDAADATMSPEAKLETTASSTTTEMVTTTATGQNSQSENEMLKMQLAELQAKQQAEKNNMLEHLIAERDEMKRHIEHVQSEHTALNQRIEALQQELGTTKPIVPAQ